MFPENAQEFDVVSHDFSVYYPFDFGDRVFEVFVEIFLFVFALYCLHLKGLCDLFDVEVKTGLLAGEIEEGVVGVFHGFDVFASEAFYELVKVVVFHLVVLFLDFLVGLCWCYCVVFGYVHDF